jgi:hypothetical protein
MMKSREEHRSTFGKGYSHSGCSSQWSVGRIRTARARVPGGPEVEAVLKRAGQLARENRQDRAAVADVRTAAGNSKRTLKRAARASRFNGLHYELRDQNFVFRLIEAARTGNLVTELSEDDRARIDAVEAMMKLPRAERCALLCEREPALGQVEQEVRSGA